MCGNFACSQAGVSIWVCVRVRVCVYVYVCVWGGHGCTLPYLRSLRWRLHCLFSLSTVFFLHGFCVCESLLIKRSSRSPKAKSPELVLWEFYLRNWAFYMAFKAFMASANCCFCLPAFTVVGCPMSRKIYATCDANQSDWAVATFRLLDCSAQKAAH